VKAIRVLKALADQITLHQSQGTPIPVQASITSKYSPFAATYPIWPKPNPTAATPTETTNRRDAKRANGAIAPAGVPNKTASPDASKKPKVVEAAGANKKHMGIFYLQNPEASVADIFPRDMECKVCPDYTCRGRECTREACTFKHPRNARDMDNTSVIAIGRHFAKTKKGWLSEYHFRHETALPADVLAMMGNAQGPKKP
jgi:hypothetical protein